jgi:hypothetical protein
MKLQLSRRFISWAVPGIAFTAIVMAAVPGDGVSTAITAHPATRQPLNAAAASSSARERPRLPDVAHVELERLARRQSQPVPKADAAAEGNAETELGNVFGATSWYVPPPPPPPPPPAPPPVPTAPPMPFTYLGRYEDAPTRLVILVKGERMYTVAEGDVIENTYRIEKVMPGQVELTYMPLNIKQSLSTGEAL